MKCQDCGTAEGPFYDGLCSVHRLRLAVRRVRTFNALLSRMEGR